MFANVYPYPSIMSMSSCPVSFGLVGFGAWGQMHAQSISGNPEAALVAIAAPTATSRELAQKLYPEAKVFADHRAMLAETDVSVVDIVTPSHTHVAICTDALNSGRHVLLEKPMALRVADC